MDGSRYGQKGKESIEFYPHDFEIFGFITGDYIFDYVFHAKFIQSGPV